MTLAEQTRAAGTYVNLSFLPGTVSEVGLLSFANAGPYIKSLDLSNVTLADTKTLKLSNSNIMYLDISGGCDALEVIKWKNKPVGAVINYPQNIKNLESDVPVKLTLKGSTNKDGLLRTAFCGLTHLRGLDYSQVDGLEKEHEISWPGYQSSFEFKYSGPARLNDVIEHTTIPVKISFKEGIADTDCADMFCQKRGGVLHNIISVDFDNVTFTKPVTNTSRMFYNNADLRETVKNLDGSHVTDASEMYKGCSKLKKVDLSNINTEYLITDIITGITAPEELVLGNTTRELYDYARTYFNSYLKVLSFNDFTNFIEELDISNCSNLRELDFKSGAATIRWPSLTHLISLKLNLKNFDKQLDLSAAHGLSELVLNVPKLPALIIDTGSSISINLSNEPLLSDETISITAPHLDNLVLDNTSITNLDLTDYPVLHYINWSAKNCNELTDVVLFGYQAVNPDKSMSDEKNLEGCLNLENIIVKTDVDAELSGTETHYTYESHSGDENHNGDVTFNGEVNFAAHQLLEYIYPVGSVYISQSEVSPSTIFGGAWETKGTGTIGEITVNMWKRIS